MNNNQWFDIIMVSCVHSRTMLHPRSKMLHLLMCSWYIEGLYRGGTTGAVQLKQLATDYSQQKHTTWADNYCSIKG